jgi:hypothetical protein
VTAGFADIQGCASAAILRKPEENMNSEDAVVCFTCETSQHVTTTIEEHAVPYGIDGEKSFKATFPVHHCSGCNDSFLSDSGMRARDAAQRAFEATLPR